MKSKPLLYLSSVHSSNRSVKNHGLAQKANFFKQRKFCLASGFDQNTTVEHKIQSMKDFILDLHLLQLLFHNKSISVNYLNLCSSKSQIYINFILETF